jgi:kynurenine formamidase
MPHEHAIPGAFSAGGSEMRDFRPIGKRFSNWGRWGADDRVGTLNHITPARVAAAAGLVKQGKLLDLGLSVGAAGIQVGLGGRINPVHMMSMTPPDFCTRPDRMVVSDDSIFMPLQSVTQWDGLGHVGYDDLLYNGVPAASVTTMSGSTHFSVDQIAARGVAGRAVLLDLAALAGAERLEAGHSISVADLETAEKRQGVQVRAGDILMIRTGWIRHFLIDGKAAPYWNGEPGLDLECAGWLHTREVAALASDNWGVEVMPANDTNFFMPLHCVLIRDMGMTLGELFNLEALAKDCAADGRWDMFFCAPPLKVTGGVGSPITPIAIK